VVPDRLLTASICPDNIMFDEEINNELNNLCNELEEQDKNARVAMGYYNFPMPTQNLVMINIRVPEE
jgi:hypothetical protein